MNIYYNAFEDEIIQVYDIKPCDEDYQVTLYDRVSGSIIVGLVHKEYVNLFYIYLGEL